VKNAFILFGIIGVLFSCNTFSNTKINIDISNINNEIIIKDENKKYVYGLYCKIIGEVNEIIEIEFTNNEDTVSYRIIPENGKIKFSYDADWYSNEFIIKIISDNNPSGYINIVYRFKN